MQHMVGKPEEIDLSWGVRTTDSTGRMQSAIYVTDPGTASDEIDLGAVPMDEGTGQGIDEEDA